MKWEWIQSKGFPPLHPRMETGGRSSTLAPTCSGSELTMLDSLAAWMMWISASCLKGLPVSWGQPWTWVWSLRGKFTTCESMPRWALNKQLQMQDKWHAGATFWWCTPPWPLYCLLWSYFSMLGYIKETTHWFILLSWNAYDLSSMGWGGGEAVQRNSRGNFFS